MTKQKTRARQDLPRITKKRSVEKQLNLREELSFQISRTLQRGIYGKSQVARRMQGEKLLKSKT